MKKLFFLLFTFFVMPSLLAIDLSFLDFDKNERIDIKDLIYVVRNFGMPGFSLSDVNNDGKTNLLDVVMVSRQLGKNTDGSVSELDINSVEELDNELNTNSIDDDFSNLGNDLGNW